MDDFLKFLGALALLALAIIVVPFVCFWLAYFGGWICSLVIGDPLCKALNVLFDTTRFTPSMLPWLAGAFGWIGGYFKPTFKTSKEK